jgi:hypothetical protein
MATFFYKGFIQIVIKMCAFVISTEVPKGRSGEIWLRTKSKFNRNPDFFSGLCTSLRVSTPLRGACPERSRRARNDASKRIDYIQMV